MAESELTFDDLCEMEPRLRKLYDLASMIGRKRGKSFCANFVWYDFLKPQIINLVGAYRTARPKRPGFVPNHDDSGLEKMNRFRIHTMDTLPDIEWKKRDMVLRTLNEASSCDDPRLWTSEAYDIAYQTIYNALPDCRGCSDMSL